MSAARSPSSSSSAASSAASSASSSSSSSSSGAASVGPPPARTVHEADALAWLGTHTLPDDCGVLTSLPDAVEFRHRDEARWRPWFLEAVELVVRSTPRHGAAVFYQTDVKRAGVWVDKSFLVQLGAHAAGAHLLWHKVVCRAPAGQATHARPGYAHLLCVAREPKHFGPDRTPDVLPELGTMTWARAIGLHAAHAAVAWLAAAGAKTIVDPFCGVGTVLAVANAHGLAALGIERNPGRAAKARTLSLPRTLPPDAATPRRRPREADAAD